MKLEQSTTIVDKLDNVTFQEKSKAAKNEYSTEPPTLAAAKPQMQPAVLSKTVQNVEPQNLDVFHADNTPQRETILDMCLNGKMEIIKGLASNYGTRLFARGSVPNREQAYTYGFTLLEMGHHLNVTPALLLEKCYILKGRLSFEATVYISLAKSKGAYVEMGWDFVKHDSSGKASSVDASHPKLAEGLTSGKISCVAWGITPRGNKQQYAMNWADVKKAGWSTKAQWNNNPLLMIRYRTATYLIRTHAPHVTFGLHSKDEIQDFDADFSQSQPQVQNTPRLSIEDLNNN